MNEFPQPEIKRVNLLQLEFSFWRVVAYKMNSWKGLKEFQDLLPTKPDEKALNFVKD